MNKKFTPELKKLAVGLIERGIPFEFFPVFDGVEIIVYETNNSPISMQKNPIRVWDAICHSGSYGRENGLLEIMGEALVDSEQVGDTVEGWLTAEEILNRIDKEVE